MEKGRIMAYIKVENLKYRYPNTTKLALDGLDFEIEKGSFVGVIGENGAGKSTLCQAFNGLVPGFFKGAYGGKVLIEDTEVAKTTVSKLCQKEVWYSRIRSISSPVQKKLFLRKLHLDCRTSACQKKR